jgi:hypothetical protein
MNTKQIIALIGLAVALWGAWKALRRVQGAFSPRADRRLTAA